MTGDAANADKQDRAIRRLLDLPEMLGFHWVLLEDPAGVRAVEVLVPLAGRKALRLLLSQHREGRPFWLRSGPVTLRYGRGTDGVDPFSDPDLRRFLLAIGARFRAAGRDEGATLTWLQAAGLSTPVTPL